MKVATCVALPRTRLPHARSTTLEPGISTHNPATQGIPFPGDSSVSQLLFIVCLLCAKQTNDDEAE